jgi:subtilisin family serine protease
VARPPPTAAWVALLLLPVAAALARASADGSDSLDRLGRELGVREVRALFRARDAAPFPEQRRRLLARLRERQARAAAAPPGARLPDLSHVYRLQLGAGVDAREAAERYSADPHVEWAQPDLVLVQDFVPDDPYFLSSGSWGQPYADLWGLRSIRAPEAWQYTRGEGAVIAVVDSGLDYTHPDMAENVWVNPGEDLDGDGRASDADRNGVDDDANGFIDDLIGFDFADSIDADSDGDYDGPADVSDPDPFDVSGHGTHVSGTAAAVGGNGEGLLGVAPRARVMALKGFGEAGGPSSVLARAIVYAAENGADVINTSWSCSDRCPVHPLVDEAVATAYALGTLVVDSAGNRSDDVVFYSPEKRRATIVVSAVDQDDSRASFSNLGFLVDVAAPGAGTADGSFPQSSRAILSLLSAGAPPPANPDLLLGTRYFRSSGTSMSAPHVTGVVALVRSLRPDITPDEIRGLLRATARDVGAPGHDRLFGAGIVDALAAVTSAPPRVRGEVREPEPGEVVDARPGRIAVRGSAEGEDFASYELAHGRGSDPDVWEPIASASSPVHDGLLALWDVESQGEGAHVLRLDVTGRSGQRVREFLPLSLERNRPYAISPPGPPALAPDVSGDLVVWETNGDDRVIGRDVFARSLRSEDAIAVAAGPGDQRFPRVSGRRVVFLDFARHAGGEVATCVADAKVRRCDATLVAEGPERRGAPKPSGDRIFWVEDAAGGASTQLCDLRGDARACSPRPVAVRPVRPFDLDVSGLRLVWREQLPAPSIQTCVLDPASDACTAQPVSAGALFPFSPSASGDLFAWERFSSFPGFGLGTQVQVCQLDRASGACPAIAVGAPSPSAPRPEVSGDVVVWSANERGEAEAIWFCEYDAATRSCPEQRLTGAAAGQRQPALSGRRVVFMDGRDGLNRIYGFDLPELFVHGARRVREGGHLQILVAGREGEHGHAPMALDAELPGGLPVESIGMRFLPLGRSRALLHWRPRAGDAGLYSVLLRGTTAGSLVTRERIEIVVEEGRRR